VANSISSTIKKQAPHAILGVGAVVLAISLATDSVPQAAAGIALVILGGAVRALRVIEHAIRDTTHERNRLQVEQEAAQALHMKYVAARALLDREAESLCAQMATLERETTERIATEREELMAELEDREADLKRQGWWLGYDAGQRGILLGGSKSAVGATVIPMPIRNIGSDATTAGKGGMSQP
jgi:hypothetical protein